MIIPVTLVNIICGNKKENGKVLEDVIWCDKYVSYRYKMGCSCDFYKFKFDTGD